MIYSMTLDPVTNVHPARIAAANGGKNPYRITMKDMDTRSQLTRDLCRAWEMSATGSTEFYRKAAASALQDANELTRIQLATR